ncbi:D-alanyl-D-alanine carboxypeptidase/D-alanyl-D-alanine endopeptidase [Salinifilum ghardaiensis]
MAEPQVPGGDGPDGSVPDTGEAARGEASEQVNEVSNDSGEQRADQGGEDSGGTREAGAVPGGATPTGAGSEDGTAGAADEGVVWPTEEDTARAAETGPDASGLTAGTDRLAIDAAGTGAGETNATGRSGGAVAGSAGAGGTPGADVPGAPGAPAEAAAESTRSIAPVEDAARETGAGVEDESSSEQTRRIPVVPPEAAAPQAAGSAVGGGPAGEESDAERTANIPVVPGEQPGSGGTQPHAVRPPASQPRNHPQQQDQQPPGDAQPTQYIPRLDPGAAPAAARPEDFGFGASAPPAGPAARDDTGAQVRTGEQGTPPAEPASPPERAAHSPAGPASRPAGEAAGPGTGAPDPVDPPQNEPPQAAPAQGEPAAGKRRPVLLVGAAALVAVLVLGAAFLPGLFGSGPAAPPPAPVQLNPAVNPVDGAGAPTPTRQGIEAQLSGELRNPALGTFSGTVVDARTGETLWAREPGRGMVPGSTAKVLTAAAALLTLDPDHRFTTKVVQGGEPGSVVLVGGGDPTLSKLPAGRESVYGEVAHLDDLAAQVERAAGGDVESVRFDTSRYAGDPMGPAWDPADIAGGYITPIEPMMLDGGRADPTAESSRRTQQPALQVAHGLASRLGLHGLQVSEGEAPENARVLGEVRSPTVRELVENMLQHSDNIMAEVMAHEVAIATGHEPSFEGATQAVRSVLARHGVDLGGTDLADGSGMSTQNRITPRTLGSVLHLLARPGRNGSVPADTAKLRGLLPGLPVAGGSGSLEDRYQGSDGRGWVRAKTGTLSGVNSLAGTVLTADGRVLVFALMSNGPSPAEARPALDAVAAGLRGCGCR